jgi:hypothetical protein
VSFAAWSPDGRQLATAGTTVPPYNIMIFDPSQSSSEKGIGAIPTDRSGDAAAWSSDGRLLAGTAADESGQPTAILLWDVAAKQLVRRIELPLARVSGQELSFVAGTHQLVAQTAEGVTLVNGDTGSSRVILKMTAPLETHVSGDGRTLMIERPQIEADLWLMAFRK